MTAEPVLDVLIMGPVGADLYPHGPDPLRQLRTVGR